MESPDDTRDRDLLYLLAENTNDVVWTMAVTGEITYVSPAVERMRGITQEEAMRQPLEEILTPESVAVSLGYFQDLYAALAEGRRPPDIFRGELEYYCADGSTVWTEVQAIPRFGPDGELLEILGVSRDISDRRAQDVAVRAAQLEAERARAVTAERERLARDLHDDLLQALAGAGLQLSRAELRASDGEDLREPLVKLRDDLQGAMDNVRRLVTGMRIRQLDGRGLDEALAQLASEFTERTGVPVVVDVDAAPASLEYHVAEALFRVAQESLANVARHAGATSVDVALFAEGGVVVLEVRDNGRGIASDAAVRDDAYGVSGMRERVDALGASLVLEPGDDGGTRVEIRVPVPNDQSGASARDSR
jgi:PAS domain S-box-containing protein